MIPTYAMLTKNMRTASSDLVGRRSSCRVRQARANCHQAEVAGEDARERACGFSAESLPSNIFRTQAKRLVRSGVSPSQLRPSMPRSTGSPTIAVGGSRVAEFSCLTAPRTRNFQQLAFGLL